MNEETFNFKQFKKAFSKRRHRSFSAEMEEHVNVN
ncbi:hypothetical protein SAMN05518683_12019 [Salibacterium halotolerans]|uniref:Uncharacterized protein n=1 Tax=Salibacterium halotolerans TaxID=1884432 RepID=A0A1I5WD80_9BACI|nr:hypothetical protein SAMN05518683_12019 [Salibacterium halotolerans]